VTPDDEERPPGAAGPGGPGAGAGDADAVAPDTAGTEGDGSGGDGRRDSGGGDRGAGDGGLRGDGVGGASPERVWDTAGIDAAFADIVARLQAGDPAVGRTGGGGPAGGGGAARPGGTTGRPSGEPDGDPLPDEPSTPVTRDEDRRSRIGRETDSAVEALAGGRFVPPDPGPLPRPDAITLLAWVAVIGGPLFLVVGLIVGGIPTWLAGAVIAAVVVGFVLLVARLPRRDETDPDDDGAVV